MKRIQIEYMSIDNEIYENNHIRIAKNPPRYDDYKELYLYELFYYDFLEDKIRDKLSKNFMQYQFYDSFIITLTNEEFDIILPLFEEKSQLEYEKFGKELFLFKIKLEKARNDPKYWIVE